MLQLCMQATATGEWRGRLSSLRALNFADVKFSKFLSVIAGFYYCFLSVPLHFCVYSVFSLLSSFFYKTKVLGSVQRYIQEWISLGFVSISIFH